MESNQQQVQRFEVLQKKKRLLDRRLNVMEKQMDACREQLRRESERAKALEQEVWELRTYVFGTGKRYAIQYDLKKKQRQYREWRQRNVIVIGGQESWQHRLRELFPNWQFVCGTQQNVVPASLAGKKYIVFNTKLLSHACYEHILALRTREQRVLYVESANMEQCLEELERQL